MNKILITIWFFSLFIMLSFNLPAQFQLIAYSDLGKNNVSQGLFIKAASIGKYEFDKNKIETGFQFDIKNNIDNNNKALVSGYVRASRNLSVKNVPLEIQAFYTRNSISDILFETNWGTCLTMRKKHFETSIGTNFRTNAYKKKAIDEYGIDEHSAKTHENFNLMYSFIYFLKPTEYSWNVGFSITNFDYFIINQETNPVLNVQGSYQISNPVRIFAQAWYKSAGAFNLNVNHFGFHFRSGVLWDIK